MPWIPSAGMPPGGAVDAPCAHVFADNDTVVANGADTAIIFDTEVYDAYGFYDAGAPTRLTIPSPGVYHIGASLNPDFATDQAYLEVSIRLNGSDTLVRFSQPMEGDVDGVDHRTLSVDWQVVASDFVELVVFQTTTVPASINCTGRMWIHKVSSITV